MRSIVILGLAGFAGVLAALPGWPRFSAELPAVAPGGRAPSASNPPETEPARMAACDEDFGRAILERLLEELGSREEGERRILRECWTEFASDYEEIWRRGAPEFADRVTSLSMKWKALVDREAFAAEARRIFEEVVSPREVIKESLRAHFAPLAAAFQAHWEEVLRAALGDGATPQGLEIAVTRLETWSAARDVDPGELRGLVVGDLGMNVASEVLAEVLVQGTVLAVGLSSSLATLGVGLVVGLAVDLAVTWVFEEKIARSVEDVFPGAFEALVLDPDRGLATEIGYAYEEAAATRRWTLVDWIVGVGIDSAAGADPDATSAPEGEAR